MGYARANSLSGVFTPKQLKLAEEVKKQPDDQRAYLLARAGYSDASIKGSSTELYTSKGFHNALVSLGVTPEKILSPSLAALDATQTATYKGQIFASDLPDHNIRLKAADQLADILGIKKQVIEQRTINVNVDGSEVAHLFDQT